MNLLSALNIAIKSLTSSKLRTFLTILGIIIGVFSVITLQGVGKGAQAYIEKSISSFGSNVLTISPGRPTGSNAFSFDLNAKFSQRDYDSLANSSKQYVADYAAAIQGSYRVTYQDNVKVLAVIGQTGNFAKIRNFTINRGREISAQDEASLSKVAVIGPDLVTSIFDDENPIGKEFKMNGVPFKVVGITDPKGSNGFVNTDESILIPLTTMKQYLAGQDAAIRNIVAEAKGPEFTNLAKDEISRILRASRNVKEGETNDFRVTSSDEALGIVTQITNVLTLFLTAIAAISLLVGGIGIMNIMFVTVSERTKEIGLRKAIGAKNNDILLQFLIEAVVVTVLGGVIGLVMGILTTALIASVANIPNVVSIESIALALGVSITIGLVFGIYPARKASKLNPIDALRFE